MEVQLRIKINRPRWLAAPPSWRTRIALAAVALLAVAVPVAWASDRFTDVPDAHPFHNEINSLATAGITTGCTPTTFCLTTPVARQAMAAFLHRGLGRATVALGTSAVPP